MRSSREIREVVSAGKRIGNASATLHYLPGDQQRFAIIISKAVGSAVERNRVKRRLRSILSQRTSDSKTLWAAVRIKPAAAAMSYQQLSAEIFDLIDRAS